MKKLILTLMIAVFAVPVLAQTEKQEEKVMKPALLVIDIQNEYEHFIPEQERQLGVMVINAAIWFFRQNNLPIIRVYHSDAVFKSPAPGTEAFEFWDGVAVDSNDAKVIKNYPSTFKKTNLDEILKEKGINTLFMTGLSAVGCVLATHHSAKYFDYDSFLVKDGIMSHDKKYTDVIEEAYGAIGWDTMKFMIEHMRK